MNTFPLEGKTCLLLGEGSLDVVGLALIEAIYKRGGHAWIAGCAESEEEGRHVLVSKCKDKKWGYSTLDPDNIQDLFQTCTKQLGSFPEVVFNMAEAYGEENWSTIYDVIVKRTHGIIESCMKCMNPKNGGAGGVIVNVSNFVGVSCRGDGYAVTPSFTSAHHAVTALTRCFGHEMYFDETRVRVVSVVSYYVEGSNMVKKYFVSDFKAGTLLSKSVEGKKLLAPDEAALKIINILNAKNGSVWYIRPHQLQPINIPDYRIPS